MTIWQSFRLGGVVLAMAGMALGEDRPNILWLTAEDMSPTLGCYGDGFATTPNIDRLAAEGVRYERCFAVSPVCSPSRSCLITGVLPATQGTHQMRSAVALPKDLHGFPSYLREERYFCTNNVKTDYNTADEVRLIEESWNESSATAHWRSPKRDSGQSFFAVFNHMVSHQSRSMVWPYEAFQKHVQAEVSQGDIHSPEEVPLPPYYPDTPLVRRELARYYDCVTALDGQVGRLLAQLEEDGLAEKTIVFFYSDHGSGMPRHKRLLHDSGMRVPLIVRFPKKYQHLAPAEPGRVVEELVSFVDFAPTLLSLVGLEKPVRLQGRVFLGEGEEAEPEYVYGSRDRIDEVLDCARSIRDRRWLYIRNYFPHQGWAAPSVFSDLGEIRGEIKAFDGQRTVAQAHYVGGERPVEELYDCEADPSNIVNLATTERTDEQEAALVRMQEAFLAKRVEVRDVGALPEGEMWNWVRNEEASILEIAAGETAHAPDLAAAWEAADLVGTGSVEELTALLAEGNPSRRFWGVIGLRNAAFGDEKIRGRMLDHLLDASPAVAIEAASWLANFEESQQAALGVLKDHLGHEDWWTALRACRAIELLGEKAVSLTGVMRELYDRTRDGTGDENLFLAFSAGAFLDSLGEETRAWDFAPKDSE